MFVWVFCIFLLTYVRVSLASLFRSEGKKGLLYCGVATQVGAAVGGVVMFILINIMDVFTSTQSCSWNLFLKTTGILKLVSEDCWNLMVGSQVLVLVREEFRILLKNSKKSPIELVVKSCSWNFLLKATVETITRDGYSISSSDLFVMTAMLNIVFDYRILLVMTVRSHVPNRVGDWKVFVMVAETCSWWLLKLVRDDSWCL